jgi:hypothetical protein
VVARAALQNGVRFARLTARTEDPEGAHVDLGRRAFIQVEPNGDYTLFLRHHRPGRLRLGGMHPRNPEAEHVDVDPLTYFQR